jgi:hypothetical protein
LIVARRPIHGAVAIKPKLPISRNGCGEPDSLRDIAAEGGAVRRSIEADAMLADPQPGRQRRVRRTQ